MYVARRRKACVAHVCSVLVFCAHVRLLALTVSVKSTDTDTPRRGNALSGRSAYVHDAHPSTATRAGEEFTEGKHVSACATQRGVPRPWRDALIRRRHSGVIQEVDASSDARYLQKGGPHVGFS